MAAKTIIPMYAVRKIPFLLMRLRLLDHSSQMAFLPA